LGGATRRKWRILDGKDESGLMSDSELQYGSPCLCRDHVDCALLQQALSCVLTHMGFMGSRKLSSVNGRWVGRHLTVLHGWHWDSVRAAHGLPSEVFTWKTTLGYGGLQLDSLIVNTKGGHSWYLCGSRVSYCQVISLIRWLLIQISAIPLEVLYHYVHMRVSLIRWGLFAVYKRRSVIPLCSYESFSYGNYDTKNGWLSYHACLA
jgi:hypothetical protein